MTTPIHFISGLPRSGSTLLSALLRQNPRFVASITGPVGSLFNAMLGATSRRNEAAVFISDEQRERLLRACFTAYYADVGEDRVIFDTNRLWTTKVTALAKLFPDTRIICCVRNPAWVIDSIEHLVRRNALQPSGIFGFRPNGTVYSRTNSLARPNGLYGFAWRGLREAVYGDHPDRLLLVRYETLIANPLGTLGAVYDFIGAEPFAHNTEDIDWPDTAREFDARLGTPGLHEVGRAIAPRRRQTVLPPDLFARFENEAFWENPRMLPPRVRVI